MTAHLPECAIVDRKGYPFGGPCFCPALRACEQRVRDRIVLPYNEQIYEDGYAAGVQAARDAVAALSYEDEVLAWRAAIHAALAAIDALREAR